ncbi:hypothetical protein B7P43_G02639 [Cryptotermes secundus]|uniref:Uncharacterized protein n=1 Tax=Cryptotermes secundus TaxID=105785 RepID=A0A2J7RG84_9NEOP|nr:hypothetical protein B7P43_G02639 [Cryptotermes secundus]
MDLYIYSLIRLHGVMLSQAQGQIYFFITYTDIYFCVTFLSQNFHASRKTCLRHNYDTFLPVDFS